MFFCQMPTSRTTKQKVAVEESSSQDSSSLSLLLDDANEGEATKCSAKKCHTKCQIKKDVVLKGRRSTPVGGLQLNTVILVVQPLLWQVVVICLAGGGKGRVGHGHPGGAAARGRWVVAAKDEEGTGVLGAPPPEADSAARGQSRRQHFPVALVVLPPPTPPRPCWQPPPPPPFGATMVMPRNQGAFCHAIHPLVMAIFPRSNDLSLFSIPGPLQNYGRCE
jgi:hypothetical protein